MTSVHCSMRPVRQTRLSLRVDWGSARLGMALLAITLGLWGGGPGWSQEDAGAAAQITDRAANANSAEPRQRPELTRTPSARLSRETKLNARAWEYTPYRILVSIADDHSQLVQAWFPEIQSRIERDAMLDDYNAWEVVCRHADTRWNHRWAIGLEQPPAEWTSELAESVSAEDFDKLIVIRVQPQAGIFQLLSRELDLMTRQWGETSQLACGQIEMLPAQCYQAVRMSFMPLARVERVSDRTIYCRMRAVNLCRGAEIDPAGNWVEAPLEGSPVWVQPTDVMLPVIRRNDRDDNFASVEIADLTFLTIESQEDSVLKCFMHTAQWAPLSGRSGSRTQKFGLVVRPRGVETRLTVLSSDPKNPAPLSGLAVYSRKPGDLELPERERKEQEKATEVQIGKTDWKGTIRIPPAPDGSVRLVYIKNGKHELKMIPVMPGLFAKIQASIPDDKARVYAEGVANGWKNRILDFVARRAILEARMNLALENEDFERARKIHDNDYKRLKAYEASFDFMLKESKKQLLSRKDANQRQRERIDNMFNNLDKVIAKSVKKPENTELFDRILNRESGGDDENGDETPSGSDASIPRPTESQPSTQEPAASSQPAESTTSTPANSAPNRATADPTPPK